MKEIDAYFPKAFLARQGTSWPDLEARLSVVATDFENAAASLSDEVFYRPVAEGKWSPAQIADHLLRANDLFIRALATLPRGEAPLQMPRGRVTEDGRPLSPAGEEPRTGRARSELSRDLAASVAALSEAGRRANETDTLGQTCIHQSFFGPMTGLELLQLSAWHISHHGKQLPPS